MFDVGLRKPVSKFKIVKKERKTDRYGDETCRVD